MKLIKTLSASAGLAAVLAIGCGTTWAATCTVPGTHTSISAAAADSNCNVINVAPGVYNDTVVVNFPGTTINGGQVGNNDFASRSANPAGESLVNGATPVGNIAVFEINAADVTIEGFTIKNTVTAGSANGVTVRGGGEGATIMNNIFDTVNSPDPGPNGTSQAVYLTAGGPDDVNIENNEMKSIHSNRSAKGVLIGDNGGANPSQNVQVKGNFIHDVTSDTRGAYGVSVANPAPNQGGVSGLTVAKNTISNLSGGGWAHGIGLEGDTPGVTVQDNDITNLTDGTTTVFNDAVAVLFEANPSFPTAEVHYNNFHVTSLQYGILVNTNCTPGPNFPTCQASPVGSPPGTPLGSFTGGPVDGTCNWWNSPSGPTTTTNPAGTGAQVSSKVNYNPWLIAPAPDGECFGGQVPNTTDQCKKGGWMTRTRPDGSTFKNQGDCMQYVNTGK